MWDVKYRPMTFGDVLGQDGSVQVLRERIRKGTALDTSYIFSGGHGQGKTTLARILGRALLCQNIQDSGDPCNQCDNCQAILSETAEAFHELDAASRGTIDSVRKIVEDLSFSVVGAPKRIYLFDEMHRMSRDSQDVLLKPLEDKRLVGIFCTTEPSKIRGTIRSRCEEYPIRRISREAILERMQKVLTAEGIPFEDDAVMTVIDYSDGHVRDVLNRLEMIAQLGRVDLPTVREYLDLALVSRYYEVLLSLGDPSKSVDMVEAACDRVGVDDVTVGLAEAAMNSYRLAHGIFSESGHMDKDLAKQVFAVYGDDVVRLAEYFLRSSRPTKVGLVCDVVRCSSGLPVASAAQSAAPPVVVSAPVLTSAPVSPPPPPSERPQVASEAPEAHEPVPEAEAPVAAPEAPVAAAPEPKPEPKVPEPKVAAPPPSKPADKIGNLGSGDPCALTEIDRQARPDKMPRGFNGNSSNGSHQFRGANGLSKGDILTTEQWSREFRLFFFPQNGV